MTATIERLLPVDEQTLLKAYVDGTGEPADAAGIYDALEVPATPPRPANFHVGRYTGFSADE